MRTFNLYTFRRQLIELSPLLIEDNETQRRYTIAQTIRQQLEDNRLLVSL